MKFRRFNRSSPASSVTHIPKEVTSCVDLLYKHDLRSSSHTFVLVNVTPLNMAIRVIFL